MINKDYFKGKKVTVVGLGRSGLAASILLNDLGAKVKVTEVNDTQALRDNSLKLAAKGINKIELGRHSEGFINGSDLIVISPGVGNSSQAVIWAEDLHIPIISEIELGFMLCPAKIIAITGTNGKTTVTMLVGEIIKASRQRAFVCGNIGNPFCNEISRINKEDFVVLEVSSFQLERIRTFKPYISVILNFTPDHLDRYHTASAYLEAKKHIYMNQDKFDYVVLNYDDPILKDLKNEIKAKIVYFNNESDLNLNQSAVMKVSEILGINRDLCLKVLRNFKGIEHRLERVLELKGIEFINDSKATNVASTIWALRNMRRPTILIAGGRDKGSDYAVISDLVKERVKRLILIGEAKQKIKDTLGKLVPCEEADSLDSAVRCAFKSAIAGDCVLLSPMCASFDMFLNYEDRGRSFKKIVNDLAKG